ncbi:MAG: aminoacetone oxidase family FAD-binding enzyme [Anaerovoracaceae bacterium]
MYKNIIIGAGPAGLFCGAHCKTEKGLILFNRRRPGLKLLMSGNGTCNLTHGGDIKDFINHYGDKGKKIRSALYQYNNLAVRAYFAAHGVKTILRQDGKVFPQSLSAKDVLDVLLKETNAYEQRGEEAAETIEITEKRYIVNGRYETENLVIATGGASYPTTGSDGKIFALLASLGIEIKEPIPALVPVYTENYAYGPLAGISFPDAKVQIGGREGRGDVLLTHKNFSGPGILDLGEFARPGERMIIDFAPGRVATIPLSGVKKTWENYLPEYTGLPKRFIGALLAEVGIDPQQQVAKASGKEVKTFLQAIHQHVYVISGKGGFEEAMATAGGVDLGELNLKTFEHKKYPGLFVIGEAADINGDTGGYNLQFAFSSGYLAAQRILQRIGQ